MYKFITYYISSLTVNLALLIFLLLGIQNSKENKKIYFLNLESVKMPISFIIGTSFMAGSITGTLIFSTIRIKNKK